MQDLCNVPRHPEYPRKVWIVIEQPCNERYRYQFDPETNTFERTAIRSLIYVRGFRGAYGWIGGTGTPPEPHFDVILITQLNLQPGDVVLGYVSGVFLRNDNDHKFVALDEIHKAEIAQVDIAALNIETYKELTALYPQINENEGWFGREIAFAHLTHHNPKHD